MTVAEQTAFNKIKKGEIKGASELAKVMKISRQYAHRLIVSLEKQKLIKFQPAQWVVK